MERAATMGKGKCESGEIMLEGIIVVTVVMFVLVWLLGVGFIYYQRYVVTTIVNDSALKISDTYSYPMKDIVIGYAEPQELTSRDLYRGVLSDILESKNTNKVENYINYRLEKTNFAGTIKDTNITFDLISDSALRRHVEVSVVCEFNTPFGFALEFFGGDRTFSYRTVGRADCTDKMEYISTVDYCGRLSHFTDVKANTIGLINVASKFIMKLMAKYNHNYN